MSAPLPERYIAATVKDLPPEQHHDVRLELQASIADAVEALIDQGATREEAERTVLTDLGDPALLAAGYADRPLQLIGPRYYLSWWSLLKRLLVIIPAAVFVLVIFAEVLADGSFGDMLGAAIPAAMTATVHVFFWTTLVFAILERSGAETGTTWDVDQLPEPRQERPSSAELVPSLIFLGLMVALIIWDQTRGFIRVDDLQVPILSPGLWPWAMLGLFAIIALEVGFALALYLRQRWTVTLAIANTVLAGFFFTWVISLLVRGQLFGAEFTHLLGTNNVSDDTLYTLSVIFGFGVAVICMWDSIDGWVKTHQARGLND